MKIMETDAMEAVVNRCKWATICTVTPDMKPYAIEATPFIDGQYICFMINPRGGTRKNLERSTDVLLKFTVASDDLENWAGVSCFGKGEFVENTDEIRKGWELLGKVTGQDYSDASEKFISGRLSSPLFRVKVENLTGRSTKNFRIV